MTDQQIQEKAEGYARGWIYDMPGMTGYMAIGYKAGYNEAMKDTKSETIESVVKILSRNLFKDEGAAYRRKHNNQIYDTITQIKSL